MPYLRFKVRVSVQDRVRVKLVIFRIRLRFHLSMQWMVII